MLSNKRLISLIMLVVGILGFIDATYLTFEHFMNVVPPCTIEGCDIVLTSRYSVVGSIPLALFGAVFYLAVILVIVLFRHYRTATFAKLLTILTICGFIISLVLFGVQAFVLKAYCLYCLGSIVTSTLLFVLMFFVRRELIESPPVNSGL